MIIQPLVENAIVYGIEGAHQPSKLIINAYPAKNCMIIEVNNTGVPISPDLLQKLQHDLAMPLDLTSSDSTTGIGMFNVNERIKLTCGEEYGLSVNSITDGITSVTLTLPLDLA